VESQELGSAGPRGKTAGRKENGRKKESRACKEEKIDTTEQPDWLPHKALRSQSVGRFLVPTTPKPQKSSQTGLPVPMGIRPNGQPAARFHFELLEELAKQGVGRLPSMDVHTAKTVLLRRKVATVGHPPNAGKLETTGWAVMFGRSVGRKIRTALSPLVELRRTQTPKELFNDNLEPPRRKTKTAREESAAKWLRRGAPRAGLEDPVVPLDGVPFYILIVASPEEISFEFQYQIDLTWGVGRLWLDTPADFERYAHSVVAYEAMKKAPASGMAIFAPDYGGKDPHAVGDLINEMLAKPLIETEWKSDYGVAPPTAWLGAKATKRKLHDIFSGRAKGGTPAALLTAGHGLQQDPDSPDLAATMGAILCQEYQGGPAEPNTYFTAKDLPKNPKVHGMIYFISACYGVGWPRHDTYHRRTRRFPPAAP